MGAAAQSVVLSRLQSAAWVNIILQTKILTFSIFLTIFSFIIFPSPQFLSKIAVKNNIFCKNTCNNGGKATGNAEVSVIY